jgi:hypothetical protein
MNLPDTYRFSTSSFSKLICLMFCVSLSSASASAQSLAVATPPEGWSITPNHLAVNCLDPIALTSLPQPQVQDISGQMADLIAEDQYFSLASASQEWTDFFAVSRWEIFKIKGDGGVDVTGAPNAILVEGANSAQVSVDAESIVQFNIVIPADGFISLDYENFGGSNLLNQVFSVNAAGALKAQKASKAKFFSPALRRGDVLALHFNNTSAVPMQVQFRSLRFYTNAAGVWERRWTAVTNGERITFPQLITVEKAAIADVLFPEDVFFGEADLFETQVCTNPLCTGYPFLDKDGDLTTTLDRIAIDRNTCDFMVSWSDELVHQSGQCVLERQWTISDRSSNNVFTALQSIHLARCPEFEADRGASGLPELGLPKHEIEKQTLQAVAHQDNF